MTTLFESTKEFCEMFGIDLNAPLKARLVLERDGVVIKDEIVTVKITDKFYTVGTLRFKKGNETETLHGLTSGKNVAKWNRKFNESVNYLYRIEPFTY